MKNLFCLSEEGRDMYERLVSNLSNMQCPNYSDIDKESVCNVFDSVWNNGLKANEEWLTKLKSDITERGAELSDESFKLFPFHERGPGNYFRLSKNNKSVGVFIGPYGNPVQFCQLEEK